MSISFNRNADGHPRKFMRVRTWAPTFLITLIVLLLNPASLFAQSQSDIDVIAEWARSSKDAHVLTLRGDVAKTTGLSGGTDVDGFGVSYTNSKGVRVVFCTFAGRPERLVVRSGPDRFAIYGFVKGNDLVTTIYVGDSPPHPVVFPNDQFRDGYEQAVKILIAKAKQEAR